MKAGRILGLTAGLLLLATAAARGDDKVVFVSFGGSYQAAQEDAYAKPFAKKEGLTLVSD